MSSPHTVDAYHPPVGGVTVLHADTDLLLVHKPAGLLTVPGRGAAMQDCLILRIQNLYPDALIVHRLDMATSGIVLLARGAAMQKILSAQFAERAMEKQYMALVCGRLSGAGEIDLPLLTDWPNRPKQKVDWELGKPALTLYSASDYDTQLDVTRVSLVPHTGRTHQLRVHLLSIGHPIVGDQLYHDTAPSPLAPRLHLHAEKLRFQHPSSGTWLDIHSPAPF